MRRNAVHIGHFAEDVAVEILVRGEIGDFDT